MGIDCTGLDRIGSDPYEYEFWGGFLEHGEGAG